MTFGRPGPTTLRSPPGTSGALGEEDSWYWYLKDSGIMRTARQKELMIPGPLYRFYAKMRLPVRGPRVFANSLPKSGTHLLSSLLRHYPRMMHAGIHYRFQEYRAAGADDVDAMEWDRLESALRRVRPGQFATGHFPAVGRTMELLDALGFRTLLMYRDPRDIAVSHVYYVLRQEKHPHHHRYSNVLRTMEERLRFGITGFAADEHGVGMPSVTERLELYHPWLQCDGVYKCRFEDLVGPQGGGRTEAQLREVVNIGRFIDRELSREQAVAIAGSVFSAHAHTFRKGSIGDWRSHFTAEHKDLFKQVAGQPLIDLGYEPSFDW